MSEVLGRHHPTVRELRALRRDARLRRDRSVFVAEGVHLAQEALAAGATIERVVLSPRIDATAEGRELRARIAELAIPCAQTTDAVLDSLQDAHSPQPILMVVRRPRPRLDEALARAGAGALVTVSHGLQDPGNLGAIVRSTDGAGGEAVLTCGGGADPFHPRTVRASMGSIFRVPVFEVDTRTALAELRARGIVSVGAVPRGGTRYDQCDLRRPIALFFGSEGQGLPQVVLDALDETVHIPLREGVDSLSVPAAAAVLLYETARQRWSGRTS